MARPTKYEPTRVKRIVDALSDGNTRRLGCAYGGITEDTFANWLARYPDFSDAIKRAEADAEVRHVANIARAAQEGTWTASAWWLERRHPQDWGRKDRVEHSGDAERPIVVRTITAVLPAELETEG